jgi:hypothetical protein
MKGLPISVSFDVGNKNDEQSFTMVCEYLQPNTKINSHALRIGGFQTMRDVGFFLKNQNQKLFALLEKWVSGVADLEDSIQKGGANE